MRNQRERGTPAVAEGPGGGRAQDGKTKGRRLSYQPHFTPSLSNAQMRGTQVYAAAGDQTTTLSDGQGVWDAYVERLGLKTGFNQDALTLLADFHAHQAGDGTLVVRTPPGFADWAEELVCTFPDPQRPALRFVSDDDALQIITATSDLEPKRTRRVGQRLSQDAARQAEEVAAGLDCPNPALRREILSELQRTKDDAGVRIPVAERRRRAGELLLRWLWQVGGFVQSETLDRFYFYRPTRRLFPLDGDRWAAWLYSVTGCNPAGTDFTFLNTDCQTMALTAPQRPVVRVSSWDAGCRVLRVSRFDGSVYVLDGESIIEEANGEKVLFQDDPLWVPYGPDDTIPGALRWLTDQLPNWGGDGGDGALYGLAFRAWILSSFFSELCPSRPLLVFLGEKGSGKTMALRLLLRLMFGPTAQVSGVPDKPDGFTAAASAAHLLVLDNLDRFTGWLRDKLARLATGAQDHYRRLYTSNEMGRVVYRCWLAFTARTPDTLKRDDLADRLLLLPVDRLSDGQRVAETVLFTKAAVFRDAWWADVLATLNQAVAVIRGEGMIGESKLRMADWEALGRIFARNEGREALWDELCERIQKSQSDFLLEDDLIVEGLSLWLEADGTERNAGREVTARELHEALTEALFGPKKPPSDWPKSAVGFGKRLSNIRQDLRHLYRVEWGKGTAGKHHERTVYRFWPKDSRE